ncbi:MAG TPA: sterol desaturase family protein [Pyrinomonadaceae bacterium]|nr:sterol desaturase family protein [Pyrinomonadaceae bacterium]
MSIMALRKLTQLFFYAVMAVCLGLLTYDKGFSWRQNFALLGLGILSWIFIEYGLHRFIFHYSARSSLGRKLVYAAHLSHHENPKAPSKFLPGFVLSAPVATAYWLLLYLASGSAHFATYLLIGVGVGYITYQLLHFQAHHLRPRLRVFRYLQTYHMLHHYRTPELRFGVTSPLIDLVFGTFRPLRRKSLRH